MITPKGFLNCYELDEWYQLMEDRAYDDIANNDDVELDDDAFGIESDVCYPAMEVI
jgi:hypothetical protein